MKKLLLSTFVALPTVLMAQTLVLSDNFDSYTAGATVAASSAGLWETWTAGATSEDPFVSNTFANSAPNSISVYNNGPGAYLHDLVLPTPSTFTTGIYEVKMKYYIETGNGGYFNLGGAWASGGVGYQYGIDVFFNSDGSGNVSTPSNGVFSYTQNAWTNVSVIVNLNTDIVELFINSTSVYSGPWGAASGFGAMDIFGVAYTNATNATETASNFYVDDVELLDWSTVGVNELEKEMNISILPNPNNGNFNLKLNNVQSGDYNVTITDLIGNIVQTEALNLTGSANLNYDLNVASGIYFVEITNGDDAVQKKFVIE
jgi:hypothetical protein